MDVLGILLAGGRGERLYGSQLSEATSSRYNGTVVPRGSVSLYCIDRLVCAACHQRIVKTFDNVVLNSVPLFKFVNPHENEMSCVTRSTDGEQIIKWELFSFTIALVCDKCRN